MKLFEKSLPKGKIGNPKEIGDFVGAIVEKKSRTYQEQQFILMAIYLKVLFEDYLALIK